MEIFAGQGTGGERMQVTGAERIQVTGAERTLAAGVAAGLERLIGLFRSLSDRVRGGSPRSLPRRG
jgi:hypothetical protein